MQGGLLLSSVTLNVCELVYEGLNPQPPPYPSSWLTAQPTGPPGSQSVAIECPLQPL